MRMEGWRQWPTRREERVKNWGSFRLSPGFPTPAPSTGSEQALRIKREGTGHPLCWERCGPIQLVRWTAEGGCPYNARKLKSPVPQVRVRLLDANLGLGTGAGVQQ
jgi:hypothetical protein